MVIVLAADTTVLWVNDAARDLLGQSPDAAIGRSIAEFVHPEDLLRAAEVMELVGDGRFENDPVAPAQYRILTGDGTWKTIEINGSSVAGPGGEMLITARFAGDLVYHSALLEAVTGGEPISRQVEIVMELGRWRYPREGYAIIAHRILDGPGERRVEQIQQHSEGLPPALAGVGTAGLATPWAKALATGEEVIVHDLAAADLDVEVLDPTLAQMAVDAGYAGCLAVTVPDPGNELGACIVVWSTHVGPSLAGHRYAVSNMTRALGLVLQQRAQLTQLERAAHVDELTGLASRGRFLQVMRDVDDGATADPRRHAVIYVDLDRFKGINDRYGHTIGDQVLAECAARVHRSAHPDGFAGRLGGDEFAVVFTGDWTVEDVERCATEIVDRLDEPIAIGSERAVVGASVGVAFGEPGEPGESVLDAADQALGSAKRDGRGRWYRAERDPV